MTRAFRTNLTALSLLALIVGTFLVYNTMTFSVVRRRPVLGMLRALGVNLREVGRLVGVGRIGRERGRQFRLCLPTRLRP